MILSKSNSPFLALSCLIQGFKLLNHPQLRKYLLIPLLINITLYTAAFVLGYHWLGIALEQLIPDKLAWLSWILWPLFFISCMVILFFSFTLLSNLIASPYYSQLSAKTLEIISQQSHPIREQPWNKVFFGEVQRIGYLLLRLLPLLLLFLIPLLNVLAPVLWSLFAARGIAMEFMAYPLENRGMPFQEQKKYLQQSSLGNLIFGSAVGLAITLPIVNLFVGQAAVIGATLYVQRLAELSSSHAPQESQ